MAVLSVHLLRGGLELSSFPLDLWQMGGQTNCRIRAIWNKYIGEHQTPKNLPPTPLSPKRKRSAPLGCMLPHLIGLYGFLSLIVFAINFLPRLIAGAMNFGIIVATPGQF